MTAERDLVRKGQEETDVTRCSSADLLSHELSLSEDRSEVNTDGLTVVILPPCTAHHRAKSSSSSTCEPREAREVA